MPRLVSDAELLTGHHCGDLGPRLLTRVGLRAGAAVLHQGRPVQAVRVPGRVAQLVQRRVRVGRLRLELGPVGQHHAVVLQAVVGPVAGDVVDADAAAADQRLGALVPLPLRDCLGQ